MKKSRLIEILKDKLSDNPIISIRDIDEHKQDSKSIYFRNKLTGRSLDFKCYSYQSGLNLESDKCYWYFFIYEGSGDYQEYLIPNDNPETYIEMVLERYLVYLDKKYKVDESLSELRKLRSSNISDEIRDYKLNRLLN